MKQRVEELIFFRPLPGVDMVAQTIWELFRSAGKWRKSGDDLLEHLPVSEILTGLRTLPGWEDDGFELPDRVSLRMKTAGGGIAVAYWYGQKPGMTRDRILCLYCRGLTETQVQALAGLMNGLKIPLQLRIDEGFTEV